MWHTTGHDQGACDGYAGLIVRAADGDATFTSADRARLDAHLAGCEACRQALADQRVVRMGLSEAFALDSSRAFTARVLGEVGSRERWIDRLDFRRLTWRLSPVAAGLALAAAFVVVTGQSTVTDAAGLDTVPPAAVSLDEAVDEADFVSLLWAAEGGSVEPTANEEVLP